MKMPSATVTIIRDRDCAPPRSSRQSRATVPRKPRFCSARLEVTSRLAPCEATALRGWLLRSATLRSRNLEIHLSTLVFRVDADDGFELRDRVVDLAC